MWERTEQECSLDVLDETRYSIDLFGQDKGCMVDERRWFLRSKLCQFQDI